MTREERLELLKQIEKDIYVCSLESTFLEDAKSCAIHSVIEELEQEPRKDYLSIDDVMSVFDDFMCGEVDEDGTAEFLEMLKDKAEIESQESENNNAEIDGC